jgi:hypothetical protein
MLLLAFLAKERNAADARNGQLPCRDRAAKSFEHAAHG